MIRAIKDYLKLIESINERIFMSKMKEVRDKKSINEYHISDDCYITFGTDVFCVLFNDAVDGWKMKRKFNYFSMSFDDLFSWMKENDGWEFLERGV